MSTSTARNACLWGGLYVVLALVSGCESTGGAERQYVFFPAPPERPRVQFLTWASGAGQVEPQQGDFENFVLGEEPGESRRIVKPYGLAARDGIVYVCDTKGLAVIKLDFAGQAYGVLGVTGPGRLKKPLNIAIDALGYKFVVDSVRGQVVVFSPEDKYVKAFDVPKPCHPVDLALHGNELYVLDNDDTCQIVVMDRKSGVVLRSFGANGGEAGEFKIPNSITISPDGFLYVSDTHNWRIQKLTLEGEMVWMKGKPGYLLGQFGRPRGIRLGPDGIVYVVDGATEIVQMFDAEGQKLMRFGGPGSGDGALGLPSSIALDKTSIPYFQKYVHEKFRVDYLAFVASQYGARLINVYAFGTFPDGFNLSEGEVAEMPALPVEEGIGPVEGDDISEEPVRKTSPHSGLDEG